MRIQWLLLGTPIILVAAAALLAMWTTDDRASGPGRPIAPAALAFEGTHRTAELPSQVPATVETAVGELLGLGTPPEVTHLIGRRVRLWLISKSV